MLTRLRSRCEQMNSSLSSKSNDRNNLLAGGGRAPAQETEDTAERDNEGIIQLQREVMKEQDAQLDDLSRVISSTKHISMAIGEELDLQNALLDDLDEDVDVTGWRLNNATRRAKDLYKKSGICKYLMCIVVLVIALVAILVLVMKVAQ